MARGARGADPAERLDAFYRDQAGHYDRFRDRLLHGRDTLMARLAPAAGEYWADLGGGTARNLDFLGDSLPALGRVDVVDLCRPLLAQAAKRCRGRDNVRLVCADATCYRPPRPLHGLWFSYSLSMMDEPLAALDHAARLLAPGGRIGVVDFFVSAPRPAPGRMRHGLLTRSLWPRWFAHDGVRLCSQLPDALLARFPGGELDEHLAPVPYLPGLRVPYFVFTARTAPSSSTSAATRKPVCAVALEGVLENRAATR